MSRRSEKGGITPDDLAKQIIDLGQNKDFTKLQQLIMKCDPKLVRTNIIFFFQKNYIGCVHLIE